MAEIEYPDGFGEQDLVDQVVENKQNIERLSEYFGYEGDPFDGFARVSSSTVVVPSGFVVEVNVNGLGSAGSFSSMQLKADFPPGIDFVKAVKGDMLKDFGFGYQAKDGHPKEGLVGAYTSSLNATDKDGVLVYLHFEGPEIAADAVSISQFKLTNRDGDLPVLLNDNITN